MDPGVRSGVVRPLIGIAGAVIVVSIIGLVVPAITAREAPVLQPMAFSHRSHVAGLQLACEVCHPHVKTGAHPGLPGEVTCGLCHRMKQGESEEAARLMELLAAGEPLRFNKLFRLPDHVFYTHRRHVGIAELECEGCHGGIADTDSPPPRPLVRITMGFCLDCHREREQSQDCNACHR